MISAKALMRRGMVCVSTIPKRSCVFNSFYITIPEMPENHVPNVGLMPVPNKFPKFRNVEAFGCYFDMGKACLDFEEEIDSFASKLEEFNNDVSLDEAMEEINKCLVNLRTVEGLLHLLHLVKQPDFSDKMLKKLLHRFESAHNFPTTTDNIYLYFKSLEKKNQLTRREKKVIARYVDRAEALGARCSADQRDYYARKRAQMDIIVKHYLLNIEIQNAAYAQEITDPHDLEEFPPIIKSFMCDFDIDPHRGPWALTMDNILLDNFFKYCSNAELRSSAWIAMVSRATHYTNPRQKNSSNIEDIRGFRKLFAEISGNKYETEAHLAATMAGSSSKVFEVLTSVSENVRPAYEDEIDSLIEYASSKGQTKEFEPCDIPYWRRHQVNDLLGVSQHDIMMNFPFEHVWSKTRDWFSKFLNISIKQVEIKDDTYVWDPSVRMYEVSDNKDTSLGFFYLDPFMRASKSFSLYGKFNYINIRRGNKYGSVPLSAIIGGLPFLSSESEHLMSVENVTEIFALLGSVMQEVLSTAPYCEIRGYVGQEFDTRDVVQYFFVNWLRKPEFLRSLSSNIITKQPIDEDLSKKLAASQIHLAAHDMSQNMMFSHIDLLMHSTNKFWVDIVKEAWKHYQPLPYNKLNHFVCSTPDLVVGNKVCHQYASLWSMMLAADLYGAFMECPGEDVPALALKYRDTFLGDDGSFTYSEKFESFRGRDPDFNALSLLNNIPTVN